MPELSRTPGCEHRWYWRRRRNATHGYWECVACGLKVGPVALDADGRAAQTPEEAMRDAS